MITIKSNLDFDIPKSFEQRLINTFKDIDPTITDIELLDFGLEDDIIEHFYNVELVFCINGDEIFISKKKNDMDTFNWFNSAPLTHKYFKYCMDTIIEMIESEKSIRPYQEEE